VQVNIKRYVFGTLLNWAEQIDDAGTFSVLELYLLTPKAETKMFVSCCAFENRKTITKLFLQQKIMYITIEG
jgi:type II secretory pathway component PulM